MLYEQIERHQDVERRLKGQVGVLLGLLEEHTGWRRGLGVLNFAYDRVMAGLSPDGCQQHNAIEAALREAGIVGGGDD